MPRLIAKPDVLNSLGYTPYDADNPQDFMPVPEFGITFTDWFTGLASSTKPDIRLLGVDDTQVPPQPVWVPLGQAGVGGASSTALVFVFIGQPAANGTISLPLPFALTLAPNFAGTVTFSTPPAAPAVFTLSSLVPGAVAVPVGTLTLLPSGAMAATLSTQAAALCPAGSVVQMRAPATVDATLADCSFTLLAARA